MKTKLALLFAVLILNLCDLFSQKSNFFNSEAQSLMQGSDKSFFIENKGQWDSDVLYLARMGGLDAWITKYGVNYTFYQIKKDSKAPNKCDERMPKGKFEHEDLENSILLGHRVLFELQNHNPLPQHEGKQKQESYYNYFIGNDPSKHAAYVGLYKEALIKNVYEGIDIRYYFDRGFLRYDYVVHPGADPTQIKFKLKGQFDTYSKDGNKLIFNTRFGEVQMAELKTYQQGKTIASRFIKQKDLWSIAVAEYDKNQTLIIDPLIYSTYIGGNSHDQSFSIKVDGSGNAYITGRTTSSNYDVTTGSFQTTYSGGGWDIFVTKVNPTGTNLIYSTFIGTNTGDDEAISIDIDASSNAYITGFTSSSGYPITSGVFQNTFGGGTNDVIVTKLNATGTALLYSTYVGGTSNDQAYSIKVDASGNAYITGSTSSTNYDVTPGVIQSSNQGVWDVFVTKINSNGSNLVFSTYLGGSDNDEAYGINVDATENVYIVGRSSSGNFDITTGAFQTTLQGGWDVFVTKLNSTGTALLFSTYIGGSSNDEGYTIAVDNSGDVYVAGMTNSTNYDITSGVFQNSNGGNYDAFVTKLNSNGTSLIYSTYIGGANWDDVRSLAIDSFGNAYITGQTASNDYDITSGAYQTTYEGGWDVLVTKLNPTGSSLIYSTYIGGTNDDMVRGIALDGSNNVYVTGVTNSSNYDIVSGCFQTLNGGASDVFVSKLCLGSLITINLTSSAGTNNQSLCVNNPITNITYNTSGATSATVTGLPTGVSGTFASNTVTISGTPTVTGTFNYTVTLSGGCGGNVTATGTITVNSINTINLLSSSGTDNQTLCVNTAITNITYSTTNATGATFSGLPTGVNGNYSSGTVTISGTPTATGTFNYTVTLTGGCGNVSASGNIEVNDCTGIAENNSINYFVIYPNPVSTQFTIANVEIGSRVSIIDITGKVMLIEKVNASTHNISTKDLVNGIYFVQLENNGQFSQKKLVVNK
ncbi:MAG: SBBP repeat-containing protein [Flavobacteriales bacterium]|nr:SBBP repeat-containing protein [Flavobacteriales bacterium]